VQLLFLHSVLGWRDCTSAKAASRGHEAARGLAMPSSTRTLPGTAPHTPLHGTWTPGMGRAMLEQQGPSSEGGHSLKIFFWINTPG